ncbi:TetR/AcrR family transcriptional regulator [Agitococcus lubricus]|uniref:TetR family transcriptional regulator n=1 Tax=Agitococcus lubricus TaxID=1077255 RepID=A0A2T5J2X0_9GAMM|nr:TetR/AcrR family transcriptional regulator [Agitococcus lubricus]PTQ90957.1 TetR family transcriptional regulator [Agitococcus lubricus]
MRKKPQQQRAQMMVNAIIDAGFISLMRHGKEGTTTRHIADIAGISVGSLYQYFADKEAIYQAMHNQFVQEAIVLFKHNTAELLRLDIRAGIRFLLQELRLWLEQNNGRYLYYVRYVLQFDIAPNEIDLLESVLMDMCMQYIMSHPQLMKVPNISSNLWFMVNGGVFAVIRFMSQPNPKISFEQLTESISDIIEAMVKQANVVA